MTIFYTSVQSRLQCALCISLTTNQYWVGKLFIVIIKDCVALEFMYTQIRRQNKIQYLKQNGWVGKKSSKITSGALNFNECFSECILRDTLLTFNTFIGTLSVNKDVKS